MWKQKCSKIHPVDTKYTQWTIGEAWDKFLMFLCLPKLDIRIFGIFSIYTQSWVTSVKMILPFLNSQAFYVWLFAKKLEDRNFLEGGMGSMESCGKR